MRKTKPGFAHAIAVGGGDMESNWEFNHAGMVLGDKNRFLQYLQSKGIGLSVGPQPLSVTLYHIKGESSVMMYRRLDGDPVTRSGPSHPPMAHTFYDGECQVGSLQIECVEVTPGPGSFITEYLAGKGEGINHLCFNVPHVEEETEKLLSRGCDLMFSAKIGDQTVENYIDTRKCGDVIVSFRPPTGEWERAWKANNLAYPLVSSWEFRGVGVVVKDLDKTSEYYQSLGFTVRPERLLNDNPIEGYRGVGQVPDTQIKARSRTIEIGPLSCEFVEPVEGRTIYQDSLDRRDEGINSIVFLVEDLEEEASRLVERNIPVLLSGKPSNGDRFAYFDTRQIGNTMVKLTQAG